MYSKFSTSRVCYFHTNKTYSYCISTNFSGQATQPSAYFVTSQDSKIHRTLIDFYSALGTILGTGDVCTHTYRVPVLKEGLVQSVLYSRVQRKHRTMLTSIQHYTYISLGEQVRESAKQKSMEKTFQAKGRA